MKGNKLKIGIVGCGHIASMKHIPSMAVQDNAEITALFDTRKECTEKAVKDFNLEDAKIYSNFDEIVSDKSIDIMHICSPNKSHAVQAIRALEEGKHVMCEKPMAINSSDARKMLDASKRTGKKLAISCQNRFRNDSQYLKMICERGDLGEIYFAKAHALRRRGVPVWLLINEQEQGGGPLIDIGIHALDLTLWLMKNFKPKYVVGNMYHKLNQRENEPNIWGPWDPKKFLVEDSAFGFITMENGATVILESSWALNILRDGEHMATLCGTEGGADMNYTLEQKIDRVQVNGSEFGSLFIKKLGFENKNNEFYKGAELEAKSWLDCIINDTEPVVKPEESVVIVEILEAISESSKSGKPIYLNK